jgi:hypothetical protein
MKRCGGLPHGWKDAIERLASKHAINREIAAVGREDFRARREIGKRNDAGIRKVRLEIGKFTLKAGMEKDRRRRKELLW